MQKIVKRILILGAMALLGILALVFAIGFGGASRLAHASELSNGNGGVYYERNRTPIESAEIISNAITTTIRQGESVELDVLLVPYFAIETVENIVFHIGQGINLAELNDNVLTVHPNATVGGIITVFARVDDIRTTNTLTFNVGEVPVESILINTTQTIINQGASFNLNTTVMPLNATNKVVRHQIIEGAAFATISVDGTIRVNNNLPRGDLSITVRASSLVDNAIYAIRSFDLFVPTQRLSLSIDKDRVIPGSLVTIIPEISAIATIIYPEYSVLSGHEYFDYINGNTIRIASNINSKNPQIVIRGMRDNIQATLSIQIYIPATALSISANSTMQQGDMVNLVATPTPLNASLANLQFFIEDDTYATIENGIVRARILPGVLESTIRVWGQIGDIKSNVFEITILNPNVVLTADNLILWSANNFSDSAQLIVFVNNVEQISNISFDILSGQEFVDGAIIDGFLQVRTDIIANNPIQIRLRALYDGQFESNEIILTIRIAVQCITINHNITEVEQQRSYDFSAFAGPTNAHNVNAQLHYEIITGGNYAMINTITGLLQVNSTASIGGEITIKISHPDGYFITHIVTVRSVFATSMEVDRVYRDGEEISISNGYALPGSTVSFGVVFPTPFNVSNENKVFTIEFVSGNINVATIVNGNQIRIVDSSVIQNPSFVVRVTSNQGGAILSQYITISVRFPITTFSLNRVNNITELTWGQTVNRASVVGYTINPGNASIIGAVSFRIIQGHAEITNGETQIRVGSTNNNDRAPNLTFIIEATVICAVNGQITRTLTFNIHVPATTFILSSNNMNPYSSSTSSSTVSLTATADLWASHRNVRFYVDYGAHLIDGININGESLSSSSFTVTRNLTAQNVDTINRYIRIRAVRGKYENIAVLSMFVHIAVESVSIGGSINRHTTILFNPTANRHATTNGWRLVPNSVNGSFIVNQDQNGFITNITVPRNTTGGSVLSFRFIAYGNSIASEFTATWTVAQLNNITHSWGTDTSSVQISQTSSQLWVGRSTTIVATRDGSALSNYGVSFTVNFVNAQGQIVSTDSNATLNGNVLRMNNEASRNALIRIRITINDGIFSTVINRQITAFRPMSDRIQITNNIISQRQTTLTLAGGTGWETRATFGLNDLVLTVGDGLGTISGRTLTVNSVSVITTFVNVSFTETYNGVSQSQFSITGNNRPSITLRTVTLNRQGGVDGSNSIVAVNGVVSSIANVPTRHGFHFAGYYTTANSGGTRFVNEDGSNASTAWTTSITELHARWNPVRYSLRAEAGWRQPGTTECQFCVNNPLWICNSIHPISVIYRPGPWVSLRIFFPRLSITFQQSVVLTAPNIDGYDFLRWTGPTGFSHQNSTSRTITVSGLTLAEGANYDIRAVFEPIPSCVAEGTLVTLADGSQVAVENLRGDELLLVWNFKTGTFDFAPIIFIDSDSKREFEIIHLFFSDGNGVVTDVKVIYEHGFWDFTLNQFVWFRAGNAMQFLGNWYKKHISDDNGGLTWAKVQLVDVQIYTKTTTAWSPVTFSHLSFYVNGMLSMPGATEGLVNIFKVIPDILQICYDSYRADVEMFGLLCWERDFAHLGVPIEIFMAFNAQYLGISMAKGLLTMERLMYLIEFYSGFF